MIGDIDDKDRMIISMYSIDPSVSQDEVARSIGLSQPSVAVRVRKLREMGAIEERAGMNPFKMGLFMAKVEVTSNDPERILGMFRGCPYFANAFTVSGRNNLCLLFMSENITTLEAIVNGHIRPSGCVSEVNFDILIAAERDLVIPTVLCPERVADPPCGIETRCLKCPSFIRKKCMGCPATGEYQGSMY